MYVHVEAGEVSGTIILYSTSWGFIRSIFFSSLPHLFLSSTSDELRRFFLGLRWVTSSLDGREDEAPSSNRLTVAGVECGDRGSTGAAGASHNGAGGAEAIRGSTIDGHMTGLWANSKAPKFGPT